MARLTEIKYGSLKSRSPITFYFDDGSEIKGHVVNDPYFITLFEPLNDNIFIRLGINNKNEFVSNIVGYKTSGCWPEVKSQSDLEKVLNALLKYNMEEKEVKIEIPEGYIIDEENSTFQCIKFKPKQLTYDEIQNKLFYNKKVWVVRQGGACQTAMSIDPSSYSDLDNLASGKDARKIEATIKLMNVAHYLNDGWAPSVNDKGQTIAMDWNGNSSALSINAKYGQVKFKTKQLAEEAVKILGTETIKQALS